MATLIQKLKSKFQIKRVGQKRGRLVRHYFLISVVLISGGLITSGLLELYFRYRESWEQLVRLQQEITASAAFKIERFIREIEQTMRATTRSREITEKGISPEYHFELRRLLVISRAITESVAIDSEGVTRVAVSRFTTVLPRGEGDYTKSPAFQQAKEGKSHFGPVYFFRGSEPYMTIAVPIERFAGRVIGVLEAKVNLKYVWDVVSGLKVGNAGYAYAVARNGDLIAHPDISLVLQRRNAAHLDQVRAAFRPRPDGQKAQGVVGRNL
ncbi:MAG: cache domain-containing protein, partial [Deltaproteobacteria bacterium]|nr:cache domain-containing protein [Deltaproteobacteria bacterium]